MQSRKTTDKRTKDDTKKQDEKNKKLQNISTPRNVAQKSATDIYSRTNTTEKAPKRSSNKVPNLSPMKDLLKSSQSSISQNTTKSFKSSRTDTSKTVLHSARSTEKYKLPAKNTTNKTLPMNVTVNSPIVKRKLDVSKKEVALKSKEVLSKPKEDSTKKVVVPERQRSNTRTLDEAEIKMLTPDVVDNNSELFNLTKKLAAKPKAFYVNLDGDDKKVSYFSL